MLCSHCHRTSHFSPPHFVRRTASYVAPLHIGGGLPANQTKPKPASMLLLSVTGYIFALQFSAVLGCAVCLLHATFRPPVARAVRSRGGGGAPELHGGDGDLEGGGGGGGNVGRGRPGPVNANMRLRTRPVPGGAMGGMSTSPTPGGGAGAGFGAPPMVDPAVARHSHAT